MAADRARSLTSVVAEIDAARGPEPLAPACRLAALAYTGGGDRPSYFILLQWSEERLVAIRDFRYARYATESAVLEIS